MSVYRVDKREQPVVLFQADGSVMKGVVFLRTGTYSQVGQQTLADLLDEKDGFLPFRTDSGSFCVVNKKTITHLRYQPDDSKMVQVATVHPSEVQISFAGGEQLCGWIAVAMPAGHNRLLDFINAASGFFPLHGGEAHYLVNAALIRAVSPS